MATPQGGIFHEGTTFHWFLHFSVRPDVQLHHEQFDLMAI